MSRYRVSSYQARTYKLRKMEEDIEPLVKSVKVFLTQLDNKLADDLDHWEDYLPPARSAIAVLDRIQIFKFPEPLAEQRWIVQVLQNFAYHNPDEGSIQDIAEWCRTSWLGILRDHPEDMEILLGLGENWLQKSQQALARIHQEEGSSSSSGSVQESAIAVAQRVESPLYVEARGNLQPAVDFYSRAVNTAEQKGNLSGKMLASAAEAYMSLGNVSPILVGEQHFGQAVRYLRRAATIPGYILPPHLQEWLNNYGRFVA